MKSIVCLAPAKLNLTLDILHRRPDGYHDLSMVMQSIALADTVTIHVDSQGSETSVNTVNAMLPNGPENIAWRGANVLLDYLELP